MQNSKADHQPWYRPRRLRHHPQLRRLVKSVSLHVDDLVMPLFVKAGIVDKQPILSMSGQYQHSVESVVIAAQEIVQLDIPAIILFGIPEGKDALGSYTYRRDGIVQQAIRAIKKACPNLLVMADLCFCEYTDHGHCGVLNQRNGQVDNDQTLTAMSKQALSLVDAGCDVIAPSGMMDGMVAALNKTLNEHHYAHIPILSYAVKYASSFYDPFREAGEGAPQVGDRKSYQMDPANAQECLLEAALDVDEGASMLMVKPAHTYLDVISNVKKNHPQVPVGAYHVSGEYAMIKAASEKGWLDEKSVVLEVLLAMKRAGADFILTYFAKDVAVWLHEQ